MERDFEEQAMGALCIVSSREDPDGGSALLTRWFETAQIVPKFKKDRGAPKSGRKSVRFESVWREMDVMRARTGGFDESSALQRVYMGC